MQRVEEADFRKGSRVKISNCVAFSGGPRWQDMTGTVTKTEPGWAYVNLDQRPDTYPVPFLIRELKLI